MATKAIPEGYRTATPYLIIKGAADAIEFYQRAFGATEMLRMADPQGRIGHAEIRIGDSVIMLADEHPAMGYRSPRALGGSSVSILLYLAPRGSGDEVRAACGFLSHCAAVSAATRFRVAARHDGFFTQPRGLRLKPICTSTNFWPQRQRNLPMMLTIGSSQPWRQWRARKAGVSSRACRQLRQVTTMT